MNYGKIGHFELSGDLKEGENYEYCEIPNVGKSFYAEIKVLEIKELEGGAYKINVEVVAAPDNWMPIGLQWPLIARESAPQQRGTWKLYDLGRHLKA